MFFAAQSAAKSSAGIVPKAALALGSKSIAAYPKSSFRPVFPAIARKRLFYSTDSAPQPQKSLFARSLSGLWKFTWISSLAAVAYLSYSIYDESMPNNHQIKHSEFNSLGNKKKNLVILGSGWGSISILKHLDTSLYNVTIISPRNYFLFTPLLPSVPTGTVDLKSIVEPLRTITRKSSGEVIYIEAEATDIDPQNKKIAFKHNQHQGDSTSEEQSGSIDYDYLIVGVGAKVGTFGTPGVEENGLFLKEGHDSDKIRKKFGNCIEQANLLPIDDPERKRLLTTVVVGGGPTGVEFAGELQDYVDQDLKKWMPDIAPQIKITLLEALPNILTMFDKKLVTYASKIMEDSKIDLQTNTMVKRVDSEKVYASVKTAGNPTPELVEIPYGVLVWATGNATRPLISGLFQKIPEQKSARRGLIVDEFLQVKGTDSIYALGDCTFTKYAPTAQVAHQEGVYLAAFFNHLAKLDDLKFQINSEAITEEQSAKLINKYNRLEKSFEPFKYIHMGALAYIGSEKAIADLTWKDWNAVKSGGLFTYIFWRTAYLSMFFSVRNRVLVCLDWTRTFMFGRDASS